MEKMSKTKKYTIFKTNNLDFNTVSFFVPYMGVIRLIEKTIQR